MSHFFFICYVIFFVVHIDCKASQQPLSDLWGNLRSKYLCSVCLIFDKEKCVIFAWNTQHLRISIPLMPVKDSVSYKKPHNLTYKVETLRVASTHWFQTVWVWPLQRGLQAFSGYELFRPEQPRVLRKAQSAATSEAVSWYNALFQLSKIIEDGSNFSRFGCKSQLAQRPRLVTSEAIQAKSSKNCYFTKLEWWSLFIKKKTLMVCKKKKIKRIFLGGIRTLYLRIWSPLLCHLGYSANW